MLSVVMGKARHAATIRGGEGQIGVRVNTRAPVPCSVGSDPGFDTINVGVFIYKLWVLP